MTADEKPLAERLRNYHAVIYYPDDQPGRLMRQGADRIDELESALRSAQEELKVATKAILELKRGTCWCYKEHNWNPAMMVGNHTGPCARAREALAKISEKTT